jgi:hypothetical protein
MICNSATRGEGTVRLGGLVKEMPTCHTIANLTFSSGSVMQWFLHLGGLRAHTAGTFRRLACSKSAGQHGYRNDPFGDARQETMVLLCRHGGAA